MSAAFDNVDSDRHSLWVQHADTHAQSNTPAARGLTGRRSPSIGRAENAPRTRLEGDSRALGGRVDLFSGRIRPVRLVESDRLGAESEIFNRRLDSTGVHSLGRVGASRVDSLTPLDPPPLASRPQPRSTRRREWAPAEVGFDRRHYLCRRHFLCRHFLEQLAEPEPILTKSELGCGADKIAC